MTAWESMTQLFGLLRSSLAVSCILNGPLYNADSGHVQQCPGVAAPLEVSRRALQFAAVGFAHGMPQVVRR